MQAPKKYGILLANLGTPDSPRVKDVRRYLSEFLNDPRVIDIPWLWRKLLVNLIIVPFRAPRSAKVYRKLWTPEGSPLLIHTRELTQKLQQKFPGQVTLFYGMRYGNPSLKDVLSEMQSHGFDKIVFVPLYPQYASATTGSTIERIIEEVRRWWVIPELQFIRQFYDDPAFIQAIAENARQFDLSAYDHIVFSYHGLPNRQVDKVYQDNRPCSHHNCEQEVNESNKYCYKATCYETTRLIARRLDLSPDKYTVAFQSRLDKDWLEPFSDQVVEERAKKGDKKLLFFSPAFVADCLETTIEIGEEYRDLFIQKGGEQLDLVPSLNSSEAWVDALYQMLAPMVSQT